MNITLKTLEEASEQEIFDQVAKHLLKQNKKSSSPITGICRYHSSDGLKCAVGCLISDEEYETSMETRSWLMLVNSGAVPRKHHRLLLELQTIHDEFDPCAWRKELNELAGNFALNTLALS